MKEEAQPAFVLHRRPYRETSFIVDLFTLNFGRMSVIVKGVRKAKSTRAGLLQPFVPLLISWVGRSDLKTLTSVEVNGQSVSLEGNALFAGFYLNELLTHLTHKWDPHEHIYDAYIDAISALSKGLGEEPVLRTFEFRLLEQLGYGLLPKSNIEIKNQFKPNKAYRFSTEEGFTESSDAMLEDGASPYYFKGSSLLAIAQKNWGDATVLRDAKRLVRMMFRPLLGSKEMNSRQLFRLPEEIINEN